MYSNEFGVRIQSFDILKFFAIFLVVWGHCVQWLVSTECSTEPVYRVIYSFHMQLFMMISGFFALSSIKLSTKEFVFKKFMQLIWPCIIWGGLLWLVLETLNGFHYGHNVFSYKGLILDFYWLADFWFLKSCFLCYCLTYLGMNSRINDKYWLTISLLVSQTIAPFQFSFMYPAFVMGVVLKRNTSLMKKISLNWYFFAIIFLIMLLFWDENAWNKSHGFSSVVFDQSINVWFELLVYRLFRLIIGVVGSLTFISLFTRYFGNEVKSRLFKIMVDYGKYTLEIYVLQSIILEKIMSNLINLDGFNPWLSNFLLMPTISIMLILVCVYVSKQLYRSGNLGILMFGKNRE